MDKKRIVFSVLLSLLFLFAVFSQVPVKEVWGVLAEASIFWLCIAVGVLAATITLTGIRWDQVLRSQGRKLRFWQVIRATWYGHFFNTILLGPAAGDLLKSTLFSREQKLPILELISASWLDRLLAGVGSVLFGILVIVLTLATGEKLDLNLPSVNPWLIVGILFALGVIVFVFWKFRLLDKIALIKKLKETFVTATVKIYKAPAKAIQVILLGTLGQILLSSVLAWTLASVAQTPLPWVQMLWVFPVIAMLSTLPISVGGVGVREGSALLLLGTYGVSKPDAVAASLLCLSVYMILATVGGILILIGKPKA